MVYTFKKLKVKSAFITYQYVETGTHLLSPQNSKHRETEY